MFCCVNCLKRLSILFYIIPKYILSVLRVKFSSSLCLYDQCLYNKTIESSTVNPYSNPRPLGLYTALLVRTPYAIIIIIFQFIITFVRMRFYKQLGVSNISFSTLHKLIYECFQQGTDFDFLKDFVLQSPQYLDICMTSSALQLSTICGM